MGASSLVKIIRDGLASRIPATALRIEDSTIGILELLAEKESEEIAEFRTSGFTDVSELGDALEVLMGLAHHAGIAWEDVEASRADKRGRLGGFETGLLYDRSLDPEQKR